MSNHLEEPDIGNLDLIDTSGTEDEDSEADDVGDLEEIVNKDEPLLQLAITKEQVEKNYNLMGQLSEPSPPLFSLEDLRSRYPQAFTPQSECALASVLAELKLDFRISPLQVHLAY